MIKCIATDMDGTLLNENQEVSDKNKQAIQTARDLGIDFVIATGRDYRDLRPILDKAGITSPAICLNGAEVRDDEGNIEYAISIDELTLPKVARIFEAAEMYFELYTSNGTYTTDAEKGMEAIIDIYHTANPSISITDIRKNVEDRFGRRFIQEVNDYNGIFANCRIYKFLGFSTDEALLSQVRERLQLIKGTSVTSFARHNIEVTHIQAQKGIALEKYTRERGISLADTMALGDNYNDLSMLKVAGHSVAMANAEQAVKEVCRYETGLNSEDGVGNAIFDALRRMKKI